MFYERSLLKIWHSGSAIKSAADLKNEGSRLSGPADLHRSNCCRAQKPRGPRLIWQLVLVWPQLRQSATSPQVHQRKHHCTKCFSSQLLLCAVCVQVSVSSQSGANKVHLEQTLSHSPSSICLLLYSAGCHGSTADSGRFNIDQESWWRRLLQLSRNWPVCQQLCMVVPEERHRNIHKDSSY